MMKKLSLFIIIVCLVAGSLQAATVGSWVAGATGVWTDGTKWATPAGAVPSTTVAASDEIKLTGTSTLVGSDITVDSTVSLDYACTVSASGPNINGTDKIGSPQTTVRVTSGASFGTGTFRFGNRTTSGNGAAGVGIQTGGTLSVGDLLLGQWGGSGASVAEGYYTISGGTLQAKSALSGRLWIGGNSSTVAGATSANTIGKFTVIGDAATISMKKLYVGSGTAANGATGTLEFQVGMTGVSRIKVSDATQGITLDIAGAASIANLLVSGTVMPAGDIVLVENTSTGIVGGVFDNLNGGSAAEGATAIIGGNTYTLTYKYVASGDGLANDIALVIPEPATMAILGLGGLLLRRRLA
jgi:hypothetical protein